MLHFPQLIPKFCPAKTFYVRINACPCFLLRIYDKARERGFFDRHWTRVELQMRDERAAAFLNTPGSLRDNFLGVLRNYLTPAAIRFKDPASLAAEFQPGNPAISPVTKVNIHTIIVQPVWELRIAEGADRWLMDAVGIL